MPTGLAAGGNEIISAPEFQRNAFSESGYFRKSRWAGNYEVFVAGKGYVTRTGENREVGKIFYLPTQADLWSPTEKKCFHACGKIYANAAVRKSRFLSG